MNENKLKKVMIVAHTHWDRMWYFTEKAAKILLQYHFKNYLAAYQKNNDLPTFVLDGQSLILDDYFSFNKAEIPLFRKMVEQKKFTVGPSFYQNEQVLVRGESIVRNLLYGIQTALKYANTYEKLMYVPDTFGQSFNLPQIVNGFDIKYIIAYRGWSDKKEVPFSNFFWIGPGKSKIFTSMLPLSYGIGQFMESDVQVLKKRFTPIFKKLALLSNASVIILPHGNDQVPLPSNLMAAHQAIKKAFPQYTFARASYYEAAEEILKNSKDLVHYQGELLDGKHSRVHRSYYSTRMDIKMLHHQNEHLLIDILEPLAYMGSLKNARYYQNYLNKIWKKLLILQGHDSLVGANSDLTNQQILMKHQLLNNEITEMINHYMQLIVNQIRLKKDSQLLVFNFSNTTNQQIFKVKIKSQLENFIILDYQNQVIEFEIIEKKQIPAGKISIRLVCFGQNPVFYEYIVLIKDALPSWGYKTYVIKHSQEKLKLGYKEGENWTIKNKYFEIKANKNGTFDLRDLRTNKLFANNFKLENTSDVGDNFNYSPLSNDLIITSHQKYVKNLQVKIKNSLYFSQMNLAYDLLIPKNQIERSNNKCSILIPIKIEIILKNNDPFIYLQVKIINQAYDHRFRLIFDSKIASKFSYAGSQFGQYKRFCQDPNLANWNKEKKHLDQIEPWKKLAWAEKPVGIFPFINYVALKAKHNYFSVMNNSSREYEIIGKDYDQIAITLFRAVSHCGKNNLLYRPGRLSGIDIASPDSQLINQEIKHNFVLSINEKRPDLTAKAKLAKSIWSVNKLVNYQFAFNANHQAIAEEFSLFKIDDDFVIESIKKAETDEQLILKLYSPINQKIPTNLVQNVRSYSFISLDEKRILIPPKEVEKNQIITLKIKI